MGFKSDADKEAFKQKLAAAGFSSAEIDTEVRNIDGPPTPTTEFMGGNQASSSQPSAESLAAENQRALAAQRKEAELQGNTALGAMKDLTGIAVTDAGKAALAVPAAYGAYELGKKAYTSIKDRLFGKDESLAETQRKAEAPQTVPETVTGEKPPAKMSATDRELWNKYAEQQAAKMTFGGNMAPQAQPGVLPSTTIQQPTVAPPVAPPVAAPAPVAPPAVQNVSQTVLPPEAGSAQPNPSEPAAEKAVAAEKKPAAQRGPKVTVPEGSEFRAGMGSGDNWLFNTYGTEGRRAILKQFNEGKPAGSYEAALELSKKAQEAKPGPQIPRSIASERGIPPPETNFGKLGKPAKIAGTAGLIMTAAQAANAAQAAKEGNTTQAKETLFNLLTGLNLPLSLFTQSGNLGEGETEELARRRYAAQVGAGRGIAPPQAYQR